MALQRTRVLALIACTAIMTLLAVAPASADGRQGPKTSEIETIADGFVTPLGLAIDRRGSAYVVESFVGALTKVTPRGNKTTLYTATDGGLPGGVDVSRRRVLFTKFTAPDPEQNPTDTTLEVLRRPDRSRTIASLLTYEQRRNPDARSTYGFLGLSADCRAELTAEFPPPEPYTGIIESNPYAVTSHHGAAIVADAAGNSLLRVSRSGRISTIAVFPPVPQEITAQIAEDFALPDCTVGAIYTGEAVPTDVEVGHDGNLYVSSLPGFPESAGSGSIWRVDPRRGKIKRVATGFSGAVDLAIGHDGTIYVAELFGNTVSAVRRGKVRTVADVSSPGAVEIGHDGRLYVTANVFKGEEPGNGTLIAIPIGRHRR